MENKIKGLSNRKFNLDSNLKDHFSIVFHLYSYKTDRKSVEKKN